MTPQEAAAVRDELARVRVAFGALRRRTARHDHRHRQQVELWRARALAQAARVGELEHVVYELRSLARRHGIPIE